MGYLRLYLNKTTRNNFFYGWIIVFMGAVGLFFSGPGQTYSISIFINTYVNDFGWSRSLVSSLYSIATLIAGLLLPILGKKIDIIGHKKMFTYVSIMLSGACIWMSFVINPFMLAIGFMFLRLLGQGGMTLLSQTLVPQWFIRRRGIALSLMALGGVVGSAVIPLLNNWLILTRDIIFAWRTLAVMLVVIMTPLGWFFIKNKPEDIGNLPDGRNLSKKKNEDILNDTLDLDIEEEAWTLSEARKTRAFWLMLFCMVIPSMINTGLIFHMVSIIENKGFSSTFAASILSTVAMVQFPCTFIAGYIMDRAKVHIVKSINYFILAFSMILMIYGKTSISLIIFGMLTGVFMAFDAVSTGVIWPNYFGRKHLGSIRGVAMTAMVIGSSLGPLPFGFAFDIFNSYSQIIWIMMIFPLLGSIASFISPPPQYNKSE